MMTATTCQTCGATDRVEEDDDYCIHCGSELDGEEDQTVFQRLVSNAKVDEIKEDLEELDNLVPEDENPEENWQWELALSFTPEDVPYLLEELEELTDDEP